MTNDPNRGKRKGMKPITLTDSDIERLRKIAETIPGIRFMTIFGSVATKGYSYHDVDIAVKLEPDGKYDKMCKLLKEVSEALKVEEDRIELIDLDRVDLEVKRRALEEGMVVIDRGFKEKLIDELNLRYPEYREYLDLSIREWLGSANPSKIDVTLVKRRMDFIKSEKEFLLEHVLSKTIEEVKDSPILKRLLERGFQLIMEAVIDICRHIVSVKGWGPAYSSVDFIRICVEKGVLDKGLGEKLIKAMRLRNVIVHRYLEIDYDALYEAAEKLTKHIEKFEEEMVKYLNID